MGFCAASVGFRKEEAFEKNLFFILNMRLAPPFQSRHALRSARKPYFDFPRIILPFFGQFIFRGAENLFSDPDSLPTAAAKFAVVMTAHAPGKEGTPGVMRQAAPLLFDKRRVAQSAGYAALRLFL